jgi:hypothetical protein
MTKHIDILDELARVHEFVHAAYLAVNSNLLDREAANALAVVLIEAENSLERVRKECSRKHPKHARRRPNRMYDRHRQR